MRSVVRRASVQVAGLLALRGTLAPAIAHAQITGTPAPHMSGIPFWFAFPVVVILFAVAQLRGDASDRPRAELSRSRRITEAAIVAFFVIGVILAVRWFPQLTSGMEGVQGVIQDFNRSGGSWVVLVAGTIALLVYLTRGHYT